MKIKIIVNDDKINDRYKESIERLNSLNIKVKKIRMLQPFNFMHHKFCVIDSKKILIGSFNWSINAKRNFENLLELYDSNIIRDAQLEFKYLWSLNKKMTELQKKLKCPDCSTLAYKVMVLREDQYHTEYKVISICSCTQFKESKYDYLDISLYNSILGEIAYYDDLMNYYKNDTEQINQLVSECAYKLHEIYFLLQKEYYIHGIAHETYEINSPNGDGEWITKIIWKDRFAEEFEDRYDGVF